MANYESQKKVMERSYKTIPNTKIYSADAILYPAPTQNNLEKIKNMTSFEGRMRDVLGKKDKILASRKPKPTPTPKIPERYAKTNLMSTKFDYDTAISNSLQPQKPLTPALSAIKEPKVTVKPLAKQKTTYTPEGKVVQKLSKKEIMKTPGAVPIVHTKTGNKGFVQINVKSIGKKDLKKTLTQDAQAITSTNYANKHNLFTNPLMASSVKTNVEDMILNGHGFKYTGSKSDILAVADVEAAKVYKEGAEDYAKNHKKPAGVSKSTEDAISAMVAASPYDEDQIDKVGGTGGKAPVNHAGHGGFPKKGANKPDPTRFEHASSSELMLLRAKKDRQIIKLNELSDKTSHPHVVTWKSLQNDKTTSEEQKETNRKVFETAINTKGNGSKTNAKAWEVVDETTGNKVTIDRNFFTKGWGNSVAENYHSFSHALNNLWKQGKVEQYKALLAKATGNNERKIAGNKKLASDELKESIMSEASDILNATVDPQYRQTPEKTFTGNSGQVYTKAQLKAKGRNKLGEKAEVIGGKKSSGGKPTKIGTAKVIPTYKTASGHERYLEFDDEGNPTMIHNWKVENEEAPVPGGFEYIPETGKLKEAINNKKNAIKDFEVKKQGYAELVKKAASKAVVEAWKKIEGKKAFETEEAQDTYINNYIKEYLKSNAIVQQAKKDVAETSTHFAKPKYGVDENGNEKTEYNMYDAPIKAEQARLKEESRIMLGRNTPGFLGNYGTQDFTIKENYGHFSGATTKKVKDPITGLMVDAPYTKLSEEFENPRGKRFEEFTKTGVINEEDRMTSTEFSRSLQNLYSPFNHQTKDQGNSTSIKPETNVVFGGSQTKFARNLLIAKFFDKAKLVGVKQARASMTPAEIKEFETQLKTSPEFAKQFDAELQSLSKPKPEFVPRAPIDPNKKYPAGGKVGRMKSPDNPDEAYGERTDKAHVKKPSSRKRHR